MKKLFYGVCFLASVSLFITLTQVSCQKSVAQRSSSPQDAPLNLILLGKSEIKEFSSPTNEVDSLGQPVIDKTTIETYYYYLMNLDGSNVRKVPINLPAGLYLSPYVSGAGRLTADGTSIVFTVTDSMIGVAGPGHYYIYSCAIDGSNLKKLTDGYYTIHGVY